MIYNGLAALCWTFAALQVPIAFVIALSLPVWIIASYPTVWVGLLFILLTIGFGLVISIPVWVASSPILLLLTPLLVIVGPLMLLAVPFVLFLAPALLGVFSYLFFLGGLIFAGGAAVVTGVYTAIVLVSYLLALNEPQTIRVYV